MNASHCMVAVLDPRDRDSLQRLALEDLLQEGGACDRAAWQLQRFVHAGHREVSAALDHLRQSTSACIAAGLIDQVAAAAGAAVEPRFALYAECLRLRRLNNDLAQTLSDTARALRDHLQAQARATGTHEANLCPCATNELASVEAVLARNRSENELSVVY